mgnify:CR=1 FL=1
MLTQCELPPDARCNDNRPQTTPTPSLMQQLTVMMQVMQQLTIMTQVTQQLTVVMQVTQQLTIMMQVMQQPTVVTHVAAAAARQLISLANVTSSSGQPGSWDQDKPTDAKIDSVCKAP